MSKSVRNALVWLKQILDEQHIAYQIVGGLAAKIHGGTRAVADIDVYIGKKDAEKLLPHIENFVSRPLAHYIENGWDLEYCQLIYQSQKIEIGLVPGTKICGVDSTDWVDLDIDFTRSVERDYLGVTVSVMPKSELIAYKRILGREVDLIDAEELQL